MLLSLQPRRGSKPTTLPSLPPSLPPILPLLSPYYIPSKAKQSLTHAHGGQKCRRVVDASPHRCFALRLAAARHAPHTDTWTVREEILFGSNLQDKFRVRSVSLEQ